jgi:hypothetical protein
MDEEAEDRLWERHEAAIERMCGKNRTVNLGWWVDDTHIASKVYAEAGMERVVVVTEHRDGKIKRHYLER